MLEILEWRWETMYYVKTKHWDCLYHYKKKKKQSKETITIYHNVSIPSQAPAPSICFKKLILLTAIVNKPIS
jgi:hypothetical protein